MAGSLVIGTVSDGTNSTSATNVIQGSAKAWVGFNGSGAATMRSSYNVGSVTYSSAGNYVVNFTNAFADTNYTPLFSVSTNTSGGISVTYTSITSTTQCAVASYGIAGGGASAYRDSTAAWFVAYR